MNDPLTGVLAHTPVWADDDSWMMESFGLDGRLITRDGPLPADEMIDVLSHWLKDPGGIGGLTVYRTPRNKT